MALNAGGLGLIPEQVTRSHMPCVLQWKTLHASTETWHSQINNTLKHSVEKEKKKKKERSKGGERKEITAGMKEHKQWKNTEHKIKWKNKFKYFSNHSKASLVA